jgi:hypothetical protein
MRVLPHAYAAGRDGVRLRAEVLRNGVTTHGHPRALIGALVYAAAAAAAFRHTGTWRLGELVDAVEASDDVWRPAPVEPWIPGDWLDAARAATRGRYLDQWMDVGREVDDALAAIRSHLRRGALARDRDALRDFGAFERRTSGSGTVAAAAALLLAARHAADPATGVRTAAYAAGADTDTLASMTGGLLGAMLGDEWLPPGWRGVQDAAYLTALATALDAVTVGAAAPAPSLFDPVASAPVRAWTEKDAAAVTRLLADGGAAEMSFGPLGRARVREVAALRGLVPAVAGSRFTFETEAGQRVYVLMFRRVRTKADPASASRTNEVAGVASADERERDGPPPADPAWTPVGDGGLPGPHPEAPSPTDQLGKELRGTRGPRSSPGKSRVLEDVAALTRSLDPSISGRDLLQMLDAVMGAIHDRVGPRGDDTRLPSGPEFRTWVKAAASGRHVSLARLSDRDIRALARLAWRLLHGRTRDQTSDQA